eukprot:g4481.t1
MKATAAESSIKMNRQKKAPTFKGLRENIDRFVNNQNVFLEAGFKTAFGVVQGGGLGYLMGTLMESSAKNMKTQGAAMSPMMAQMQAAGGPIGQAKGLAALCGVSGGLNVILKRLRNGKEDIWTQMGSAAGGGAAFTIASGTYSVPAVMNSALVLGLVTGGFYKLAETFKPQYDEREFEKSDFLLKSLGFDKYSKNLKKGLLTDNTISLWNESTLREVKIPPGPRLLILHHVNELMNAAPEKSTRKQLTSGKNPDKKIAVESTAAAS